MINSIQNVNNLEILTTEVVQIYIDVMWGIISNQVLFDSLLILIYTLLLTFDMVYAIKSTGLYVVLLLLLSYWIGVEILNAVLDEARKYTIYDGSSWIRIIFNFIFLMLALAEYESEGARF